MSVVFYRADSQSSALDQALALELDGLEDLERELAVLRRSRGEGMDIEKRNLIVS